MISDTRAREATLEREVFKRVGVGPHAPRKMDNITHTLFGATVARASLGRAGRGATAAFILASNAPDIDIVAAAGGAASYLQWHRGPTHGPLAIVGLGLVTAGIVYGGRRLADRRPRAIRFGPIGADDRSDAPAAAADVRGASFARLAAVAMAGVLLHVLMDVPTSYGSRLLSPFDWHWYAVDWLPIIDLYLLLALAAGLAFVRSDAARSRSAIIVLVLMAANYGLRAAAHDRALTIAPRIFGPLLPGRCDEAAPPRRLLDRWPRSVDAAHHRERCLVEIAATPGFRSPFEWRLIAQVSDGYHVQTINLLNAGATSWTAGHRVPNVWTPAVGRAARTHPAQVFLGFSRFPAVRVSVDSIGVATVQWSDIRFSGGPDPPRPQNDGRGDLFGARVRFDPDGDLLEARMGR